MANGQNVDVSVGLDQILQLGEVATKILMTIVESQKAEFLKQVTPAGEQDNGGKADPGELKGTSSVEGIKKNPISTNGLVDQEIIEKLDAAFKEFLLVSREVINQLEEPVIDLTNEEQLIDPKPITREEKTLAKDITELDQAVERSQEQLNRFNTAAQDNRINRRSVMRILGEKMIQVDDKRLAVVGKIDNYFSNAKNRARVGFASWMVNQFEGINSRFEQIKNVANQQIEEITKAEQFDIQDVPVQDGSFVIDPKLPEIDKVRVLLANMENSMQDLTKAIHDIGKFLTDTREAKNEVSPLKTTEGAKMVDPEVKTSQETEVMGSTPNIDKIVHADEYGHMLLDLHDGFDSDPNRLVDFLQFSTRFQQYTTKNQQLIFAQNKSALKVANFQDLTEEGFQVVEGEKAIKVFVPNQSESGPKFIMGSVYDLTQTDCPVNEYPIIEKTNPQDAQGSMLITSIQNYCRQYINSGLPGLEGQLEAQAVAMMLMAKNNMEPTPELKENLKNTYQAFSQSHTGSTKDRQKSLDAAFKKINQVYESHAEKLDQYLSHEPVTAEEIALQREVDERREEDWEPEM